MKILILGAGKVGATLASHLSGEAEDITIVDLDEEKLRELRDRFDLQTVVGHASRPDVLRRAGADSADMLIAVTGSELLQKLLVYGLTPIRAKPNFLAKSICL